jgi:CheY-like chemotaxis protein
MAAKPLIMVVEHNQKTQDIVRMDLETIGYEILPVLTTEEAWNLLEEGTNLGVMVLGFHFPEEDGPAFYRRLKGDPRFKIIPVVPLVDQSKPDPKDPRGVVTNTWREPIDKTPPHVIIDIKQALRQKSGVWAWLEKQMAKLIFGR